jgi:hypothetical protein
MQLLSSIPGILWSLNSQEGGWIKEVAHNMRTGNYSKFTMLTRTEVVLTRLQLDALSSSPENEVISSLQNLSLTSVRPNIPRLALLRLVTRLRRKMQETSWRIIRSAYREMSCTTGETTSIWLEHSLGLEDLTGEDWLKKQAEKGYTRAKEGASSKWIICKVK